MQAERPTRSVYHLRVAIAPQRLIEAVERVDVGRFQRDGRARAVGGHDQVILQGLQLQRLVQFGDDHVGHERAVLAHAVHLLLVPVQVVFMAEQVAAVRAAELALFGVRAHVRPTHHFRPKSPRALWERTGVRPVDVVHALVLRQRGFVDVGQAADITENAALRMQLPMGVDGGGQTGHEIALAALVLAVLAVRFAMRRQIGGRLESFAADFARVVFIRLVHLEVFAKIAQAGEHFATLAARVRAGHVLLLHVAYANSTRRFGRQRALAIVRAQRGDVIGRIDQ